VGDLEYLPDIQQSDMPAWLMGIRQRVSENSAHRLIGQTIRQDQLKLHSLLQVGGRSIMLRDRVFVGIAILNVG
jgi:hypothetical protein